MERGDLVPDSITIPMVLESLKEQGAAGWLLDGFPRNMAQAAQLWEALRSEGIGLDYVVEIVLPREIARERITGRRLCSKNPNHPNNVNIEAIRPDNGKCRICGSELTARPDDQDESAINKRHDIYYDNENGTLAAARFFRDLARNGETTYVELNGRGSIDDVKNELLGKL